MFKDFSTPTRICSFSSNSELLRLVNLYNGISPIYTSVYWYDIVGKDDLGNEIRKYNIDRAFFDFDNDTESAKKFVEFLQSQNIKFIINFSGRGHHVYTFCEGNGNGQNLKILQLSLLNSAGVLCDPHVIGDQARVSRVANTWNHKAKKFCIPIRAEEIGNEPSYKQRFERVSYGSRVLNLSDYIEDKYEMLKPEHVEGLKINSDVALLPCIRSIIETINPPHNLRYVLVIYLSDAYRCGQDIRNFKMSELSSKVLEFIKLNCNHWLDFDVRKTAYQVRNILPKSNIPADCKFIKEHGGCINCKGGI